MIIVAGHLTVDPSHRADYLENCIGVITQARGADGCQDFALSADLLDHGRINVFERWESEQDLQRFRGSGPSDDQAAALLDVHVENWTVIADED